MFFVLSKIAGFLLAPSNALLVLALIGATGLLTRWRGAALGLILASLAGFGLIGLSPLGNLLMAPLENRFPPPELAQAPDGVIVLGGSVSVGVSADRDMALVNESAERLFELMRLADLYPQARIVFTGGYGALGRGPSTEAEVTRRLLGETGFDTARITFEDRSRNTAENAAFTRDLVSPRDGETWLLVTSAYHMPRAMGVFRRAGFDVTAWPTDYRTRRAVGLDGFGTVADGLKRTDTALREWVGLVAYRWTGRTDILFPSP